MEISGNRGTLLLSCTNLKAQNDKELSGAIVAAFLKISNDKHWTKIGHTEVVKGDNSPDFETTLSFFFLDGSSPKLRLAVFDSVDASKLTKESTLGFVDASIDELQLHQHQDLPWSNQAGEVSIISSWEHDVKAPAEAFAYTPDDDTDSIFEVTVRPSVGRAKSIADMINTKSTAGSTGSPRPAKGFDDHFFVEEKKVDVHPSFGSRPSFNKINSLVDMVRSSTSSQPQPSGKTSQGPDDKAQQSAKASAEPSSKTTPAPIKTTQTPIKATPTPIKATPTPIKATPTPIKSAAVPIAATSADDKNATQKDVGAQQKLADNGAQQKDAGKDAKATQARKSLKSQGSLGVNLRGVPPVTIRSVMYAADDEPGFVVAKDPETGKVWYHHLFCIKD